MKIAITYLIKLKQRRAIAILKMAIAFLTGSCVGMRSPIIQFTKML
ncbi:hypothetical protein [Planktothrix paucivesiculata]|nr:hypothetical protein [Planktothrix paucivesiculata]